MKLGICSNLKSTYSTLSRAMLCMWGLVLVFPISVRAQQSVLPTTEPGCVSGGEGTYEVYDDGSIESGFSVGNPMIDSHQATAQLFNPDGVLRSYRKVCVELHHFVQPPVPDDRMIDIQVFDGTGGTPGALLGTLTVQALQIPITGQGDDNPVGWYEFDISEMNVTVDHPIFIGVSWESTPDNVFVGFDTTHQGMGIPPEPMYFRTWPLDGDWTPWTSYEDWAPGWVQALSVRATYGPDVVDVIFKNGFD